MRESEGAGRLTPPAREILPAAEILWLLMRSGAVAESTLPQAIRDLAASPLEVEPRGRPPLFRPRPEAEAPAAGGDRVVQFDFDRDGVTDRLIAGPTDAAESAAWILTGKIFCGERAARAERGLGEGRFEPWHAGGPPAACLPSGHLSAADVDGDANPDLRLQPDDADPARLEPEIRLLAGSTRWTVAAAPAPH
ncbi:MAG: VCBS repeat-containing protein [Acidobacteria bacterium]|nr:VCBS repeat-containing protein [Acidobacteriota bacterium]